MSSVYDDYEEELIDKINELKKQLEEAKDLIRGFYLEYSHDEDDRKEFLAKYKGK